MKAIDEISLIVKSAMEKHANYELYQAYNKMSPEERQRMYDDIMERSGGSPTKSNWVYFTNLHKHEIKKEEEAKARREAASAQAQAQRRAEENRKRRDRVTMVNNNHNPRRPAFVANPPAYAKPAAPAPRQAPPARTRYGHVDSIDAAFADLAKASGNSYVHGGKTVYSSR